MVSFLNKRVGFIIVVLLFAIVCARVLWLANTEQLQFETSLSSLLPSSTEQNFEKKIEQIISAELENRILIAILGKDFHQSIRATDLLTDGIENDIESGKVQAEIIYGLDQKIFSDRIIATAPYSDRLISDMTADRIVRSPNSQLNFRKTQSTQFPPTNLTSLVSDPLGILEEFLLERMPGKKGVIHDGMYFKFENGVPGILVIVELTPSGLGGASANRSTESILQRIVLVEKSEDVEILATGFPVHAAEIRNRTTSEIMWMSILAISFTLLCFIFVTRSLKALISSIIMILVAIVGAITLSQATVGLPHLIGLTMATTAIGICIDFSFHFWVHIKSGLGGNETIKAIKGGINMGFLTSAVGLIAVAFVSVPVLSRSAVFIFGALFFSWMFVLIVLPQIATKTPHGINQFFFSIQHTWQGKMPLFLPVVIVLTSSYFLMTSYYIDDSPIKLGQKIERLSKADNKIQELLGIKSQSAIYLVNSESPNSLLSLESHLMRDLGKDEIANVVSISRLIPEQAQQISNSAMYHDLLSKTNESDLQSYLELLKLDRENLQIDSDIYSLEWVLQQPWADLERHMVLECQTDYCVSMMRASGGAVEKINIACQKTPNCRPVVLSEIKKHSFSSLRTSLIWALGVAGVIMFLVLYLRYRFGAIKLILVPIVACISGVAAVSALGMPITTFTWAALFPLLGLSIDYVIFVKESSEKVYLTMKAISASAVTTCVSFFILAFSSTPAVQFFAIPVAVGIPVAWIIVQTNWFQREREFT